MSKLLTHGNLKLPSFGKISDLQNPDGPLRLDSLDIIIDDSFPSHPSTRKLAAESNREVTHSHMVNHRYEKTDAHLNP